jgi:hypothetical protein
MVNFLQENELLHASALEAKFAKVNIVFDEAETAFRAAEGKCKDMAVLRTKCTKLKRQAHEYRIIKRSADIIFARADDKGKAKTQEVEHQ